MGSNLTVLGATGRTGRLIVERALAAGHDVTAVVRNPAKLDIDAPNLQLAVVPDPTDAAALEPFVADSDAVLTAIGPVKRKQPKIAEPVTRALVQAMDATGARRIVTLSASPVGPVAEDDLLFVRKVLFPMLGGLLKDVFADHSGAEEELKQSALEWTAVRPGWLRNKPFTGRYRKQIGSNLTKDTKGISRADLAQAMLDCIDDPATVKQPVGVAAA